MRMSIYLSWSRSWPCYKPGTCPINENVYLPKFHTHMHIDRETHACVRTIYHGGFNFCQLLPKVISFVFQWFWLHVNQFVLHCVGWNLFLWDLSSYGWRKGSSLLNVNISYCWDSGANISRPIWLTCKFLWRSIWIVGILLSHSFYSCKLIFHPLVAFQCKLIEVLL